MPVSKSQPPHEIAAIVELFLDFIGLIDDEKRRNVFPEWCGRVKRKNIDFGKAFDIIKSMEGLPIEYNKTGALINKLKLYGRGAKKVL